MNKDVYSTFHELASHNTRGHDYGITLLDRGSHTTIIAPHAGGIEPGASEIALAIAGDDFNCYLFEGLRADSNRDLHLTSTRFDEPRGLELVRRSSYVLAVHGCVDKKIEVRVGGLDILLKDRMVDLLRAAGFKANPALGDLSGSLATNLCNMGRSSHGVQLEFTTGLRRFLFKDLDSRAGRQIVTPTYNTLIRTIRVGLLNA